MEHLLNIIRHDGGGTLGIDDATENIAKARSKVILQIPCPMFIEYLPADLEPETTPNIVMKVTNTIRNIEEKAGCPCVTNYISENCNGMRYMRKKFAEQKEVKWQYGCAPNCLTTFTEETGRLLFKGEIKVSVSISKTIKNTGMIPKLFDLLCKETFVNTLDLPFFSKTRWSSINYMFSKLK